EVSISWPVLSFAAGLSVLVALGLGVFTAMRGAGDRGPLLDGGRGQAGSLSASRGGRAVGAAQPAITDVLLGGAGLIGRRLLRALSVDPGFRTESIVTVDVSMPSSSEPGAKARLSQFFTAAFDRLRAVPGIQDVGAASAVPLDGGLPDGMFLIVTAKEAPTSFGGFRECFSRPERIGTADFCSASAGYFRSLGIPLVRGRMFDEHDGFDGPHVALISESLARSRWPNEDPLGRTIEFGNMDGDLRL